MKLVELAEKWKNSQLSEEDFVREIETVEIFKMQHLKSETDDELFISINGDSWDEVLEEVFYGNEDSFFKFQKKFSRIKERITMENLIIHLFNFEVDTTEMELFNKVGDENFDISISTEKGTLKMAMGHVRGDYSHVKIFEIYKNIDSYDVHRASDQFNHYLKTVGHLILKRDMIDLCAKFMIENAKGTPSYEKGNIVEIKQLTVTENFEEKLRLNEEELREKIENNENLLAYYLMKDKNSTNWYIYKVLKKDGKEDMLKALEDEIIETKITIAQNDNTVSKGRLGR